ncbi:MAG TPA: ABC transporter ATP-binding protein [Coriobacteriia bacterium]
MTSIEAPTATSPLIAVSGLTKSYEGNGAPAITAVNGVELDIAAGEFLMITGRSGSGKTTLLNLIAGLATPSAGTVSFEGVDMWSLSDRERTRMRGERIGFVFQFPSLIPTLTALENVALPLGLWPSGLEPEAQRLRALEVLTTVGLEDKAGAWPRQLSAGQQQRVVLARALVRKPSVILADEPTSNLDEATEAEVMKVFQAVRETTDVTVCMVTHTTQLTTWGTRSVRMASGSIVEDSATS